MAINARVSAMVQRMQGRVDLCFQSTLSIFLSGKKGVSRIQDKKSGVMFGTHLNGFRNLGTGVDPRNIIPPNLYDVFGIYLGSQGMITHSVIVVDVEPAVKFADYDIFSKQTGFIGFGQLITKYEAVDKIIPLYMVQFPSQTIETSLRGLGLYR